MWPVDGLIAAPLRLATSCNPTAGLTYKFCLNTFSKCREILVGG